MGFWDYLDRNPAGALIALGLVVGTVILLVTIVATVYVETHGKPAPCACHDEAPAGGAR